MRSRKSKRRIDVLNRIVSALKHDEVFQRIKYKTKTESEIQNRMAVPLHREVVKLYEDYKKCNNSNAVKKANISFSSEEDPNTTVSNFVFMGVQHRPDFTIEFDGLKIAVEVKKGDSGKSVREGIGQSIVYSSNFDFIVYTFVDTSDDERIKNSFNGGKEQKLKSSLWENYNIVFDVV